MHLPMDAPPSRLLSSDSYRLQMLVDVMYVIIHTTDFPFEERVCCCSCLL
jgi:hypothetical protein